MGDTIRLAPFSELLARIAEEYRTSNSIFGIPASRWYRPRHRRRVDLIGEECATPIGPAAGPHTQLAGNIGAAYLTGGRFMELKTVQVLDALEIGRPCIDAADEGYNSEWSTELTLEEAWREYAKGWIILHLLEELLDLKADGQARSFAFNMSVGYDLEGITSEGVRRFISRMKECSSQPLFQRYLAEARQCASLFRGTDLQEPARRLGSLEVSGEICSTVTLSTMHGCPPGEIEAICGHMILEEGLHTYVKLNPTLLGYETVRSILDGLGYDYIEVKQESFEEDLSYPEAVRIITRLREVAEGAGRRFGVKLSNTLPASSSKSYLPAKEVYLSGRPLYPLTITLASKLAAEFDGELPISYSGGVTAYNVAGLFAAGIKPITVTTELLKPGGYLRQLGLLSQVESVEDWERQRLDVAALEDLAAEARQAATHKKDFRGEKRVHNPGALPLFDCYVAPCVTACPIAQDVPEYIRLAGEGRYGEALELIYERNALPSVTGHICAHPCQSVCSRLDYEGCVNIREVKRVALTLGGEEFRPAAKAAREERVAVVGGGPTGVSAAYFLAREGFRVALFERPAGADDLLGNLVPRFRVSRRVLESDLAALEALGVRFELSEKGVDPAVLLDQGYNRVILALPTIAAKEGTPESVAVDAQLLLLDRGEL
ncbi:MAG: FAD-dependent oxidoreductase, partial [Spirochaetaceae bacterium]